MAKQTFLRGTFILIIAGMITKILGVINKIVLARVIGDEGVGLYMMAYPTLILVVTLTQLGLPVAISKLVAEANAYNDRQKIKRILTVSFTIVGTLSIIFTIALMTLAPLSSHILFTDPRTLYPLLAIAPIIPIVGIASVLRGYFQGVQNMSPYAYSQVIEQIVRISLVYIFASSLLPYGIEFAAAGAMISGVIGEAVSLIYMILMFKAKKRIPIRKRFWNVLSGGGSTFRQLMGIALPTTGSRLIGSISYFLEPIVVAQSLALAGVATAVATKQYGEIAGYAIPLLTLPSFITHSLHVSLVPTISEAQARNRLDIIQYRVNQALKIALIAGGISLIIAFVFAKPIMTLMYHSPNSAIYVYMMAPFFLLFYFQGPLAAVLQALDLARAAMVNSFIGAAVKIATIFVLGSRADLGIMGAAMGYSVGVVLVTLLHFFSVVKTIGFTLNLSDYVKGVIVFILTGAFATYCNQKLLLSYSMLSRTCLLILVVLLFYLVMIFLFRLIRKDELANFPIIRNWIN
ncbi:stage V sporulation protein B [Pullulanibacillus sp. KACC 23026]|uniref:stage V sporulation protein B n=1 Tax=Pullulanibacillus sp. KACC 23026 TaxID=3028315 RepID=UPI0023AFFE02|nr:stage V sporulation protein B [Pullulanibacillus sp. KACC 23026]WEG14075.1 stage V sporulation protein B [Pullulanibacillus sp. KACC 23026]